MQPKPLDLRAKGRGPDGKPIYSDRKLFVQLLAFEECEHPDLLVEELTQTDFTAALYLDVNNPRGIALVTASEDPGFFTGPLRRFLADSTFTTLHFNPGLTMMGRTYSLGYEDDLDEILVDRPARRLIDSELKWAIWYPLRRKGSFAKLKPEEQREVLMEHGRIGFQYGEAGLAQDIRLACFGLDENDNDFVIGLLGSDLAPLSSVVESMRKTRQTSEFIDQLGPFFVGRVHWQSGGLTVL